MYTREQGLARLGLHASASVDDIHRAFKDAVRTDHPDASTPDGVADPDMQELVEARDAALGLGAETPETSTELVHAKGVQDQLPALTGRELQLVRTLAQPGLAQTQRPTTDTSFRPTALAEITSAHVSRIRDVRRKAVGAGAFLTSMGGGVVIGSYQYYGGDVQFLSWPPAFVLFALAGFQGIRYAVFRGYGQRIQYALDDAHAALSDGSTFVQLLDELTYDARLMSGYYGDSLGSFRTDHPELGRALPPWSLRDLQGVVEKWAEGSEAVEPTHIGTFLAVSLRDLASLRIRSRRERIPIRDFANTIGAYDFARLLVEEGRALDLLSIERERDGVPGVYYEPTFELRSIPRS